MLGANQDLLGYNLFAYCSNNPVNMADPDGESFVGALLIVGAVVFIAFAFKADNHNTVKSQQEAAKAAAEKKYNESTVNVYTPDSGKPEEGKVNVKIDKNNKRGGKINPNIHIENSYKIQDSYEMRAILEVVMRNSQYDTSMYYRSIGSYEAEWWAHNLLYQVSYSWAPDSLVDRFRHADLDNNDIAIKVWDFCGGATS